MEMALNMGAFEALDQQEMFAVSGGDSARQAAVAAHRASGSSIGSTRMAVSAQSAVTGSIISTMGVACLCVPGLQPVGAVCTIAGAVWSYVGFGTMG